MTSNSQRLTDRTASAMADIRATVVERIREARPGKTTLIGEASPSNSYVDIGPGEVQSIEENTAEWLASRTKRKLNPSGEAVAWKWGL